jgi:RNA polymerase sigma factor (TIGR02999 family)
VNDVTRILSEVEQGDLHAAGQLLPLVYDELRQLAAQKLAQERPGQTLEATALVHEAYLRLVARPGSESGESEPHWNSRGHFFAAAAEAMRRILVENARRKQRVRHGGGRKRLDLDGLDITLDKPGADILDLDEALAQLATEEPSAADVVKLRYFAGLTTDETAAALGMSARTAKRHWAYAKAWLYQRLSDQGDVRGKS